MWAKHKICLTENQRMFSCTVCDYSTDRRTRYNQHMDSHANRRRHACTQCSKSFTSPSTLKVCLIRRSTRTLYVRDILWYILRYIVCEIYHVQDILGIYQDISYARYIMCEIYQIYIKICHEQYLCDIYQDMSYGRNIRYISKYMSCAISIRYI